jgi:predicted transposase YbfD/YdcC
LSEICDIRRKCEKCIRNFDQRTSGEGTTLVLGVDGKASPMIDYIAMHLVAQTVQCLVPG